MLHLIGRTSEAELRCNIRLFENRRAASRRLWINLLNVFCSCCFSVDLFKERIWSIFIHYECGMVIFLFFQ
ncbi:MAG: hypothetical protein IJ793_04270, partial [Opitutales bacterium]|nr:hypothetical protein [Opitutales bacterium]